MELTSRQVRNKFKKMWPDLEYIWLFDRKTWLCLSLDEVKKALAASKIPSMQWIDEFNDCDDFALQFLAETRRKQYFAYKAGTIARDSRIPIAMFLGFGNKFRGINILHMLNIAICDDGEIYIVDATPSANRIWKADAYNNNVLYISSV